MNDEINRKFLEILKAKKWDKAIFRTQYSKSGSSQPNIVLYNKGVEEHFIGFEIFDIADILEKKYKDLINDINRRFNKVEIEILNNGVQNEKFWWDDKKEQQDKLNSANVFYQWLNETLINRIFDYEKQNELISIYKDEDGDIQYDSSWDNGIFIFKVKENQVIHDLELIKNNLSRNLDMPLPKYVFKGILEHHRITNNELNEDWISWNKLTIKSPHDSIPYNKWEDYVNYELEKN